jgi:hypothetical protein
MHFYSEKMNHEYPNIHYKVKFIVETFFLKGRLDWKFPYIIPLNEKQHYNYRYFRDNPDKKPFEGFI